MAQDQYSEQMLQLIRLIEDQLRECTLASRRLGNWNFVVRAHHPDSLQDWSIEMLANVDLESNRENSNFFHLEMLFACENFRPIQTSVIPI
jgi:hypothetical protein